MNDMEPISDDDDGQLMTIGEFEADCRNGGYIDYDGTGYYATATHMSKKIARPSDFASGIIDRTYTHVMWFNK